MKNNMNKQKRIIIGGFLVIALFGAVLLFSKSDGKLISPQKFSDMVSEAAPAPTPSLPDVPAYNPPPEIKYDSTTNLQSELESINPQILDNDFTDIKDLAKSF